MALNLRGALKKQRGGSIGVTIDGKKVWFDEKDFMSFLDEPDTKEKVLEYIAPGRKTVPEGYNPKYDVSKERPQEAVPKKPDFNFQEEDNVDLSEGPQPLSSQDKIVPEPEQGTPDQTMKTPEDKIMSKAGKNPRKDEFEAVSPENWGKFVEQKRKTFNNHMKKYDILNKITPQEASKRQIEAGAQERFEEFAQKNGQPGMKYELLDDYKRDPELREFMFDYNRWERGNKEAIIDLNKEKYLRIKEDAKEDLFQYKKFMDENKAKMEEQIKERKEAMKAPEEKVKTLQALAKAKKNLNEAMQPPVDEAAREAYQAEVDLLMKKLGRKGVSPDAEITKSGTETTDPSTGITVKRRAYLIREKGMSETQADAALKAYNQSRGIK